MKIFFFIRYFPVLSQTFVIDNIINVAKSKFDFKIITAKKQIIQDNIADQTTFDKYINQKQILELKDDSKGFSRYLNSLFFLLNIWNLYYFIKIVLLKKNLSFKYIYYLKIYSMFNKNDIIHVHFANSLHYLLDYFRINYIKSNLILSVHGKDLLWLEQILKRNNNRKLLEKHLKYILCNSYYTKKLLLNMGIANSKLKINYLGVDTNFFSFSNNDRKSKCGESFKLISVGRVVQLKGHEFAIRAVKMLIDNGLNVSYFIIGDGSEIGKVRNLIDKMNMNDYVKLIGEKNKCQIKNYLSNCDVFLYPSTYCNDTKRKETFGVASIEAQAMGLPVIGFDIGGFPETMKDDVTGFLVKDRDVIGLSQKIKKLYNNQTLLNKMSTNAINFINENYSQNLTNKALLKFYCKLIS